MNEIGATGPNANGVRESIEELDRAEPDDDWMRRALHDLSQPLTALECLLYVNREPVAGESLDAGFLRSVMEEGLVECGRMLALVRGMQDRLRVGKEAP